MGNKFSSIEELSKEEQDDFISTTGTIYPEQEILIREELPVMSYDGNRIDTIISNIMEIIPTSSLPEQHHPYYMWSNDGYNGSSKLYIDISKTTGTTDSTQCNYFSKGKDRSIPYSYMCSDVKQFYSINKPFDIKKYIDFSFQEKPPYSREPYEYDHIVTMFGRQMKVFNMYLSYDLSELLEEKYITFMNDLCKKIYFTNRVYVKRNEISSEFCGLGQLIVYNRAHASNIHHIKLQMTIDPIYMLWATETMVRHFTALQKLGLYAFKFLFLHGEYKLTNKNELYPDMSQTTLGTIQLYSRELTNPDKNEAIQTIIDSSNKTGSQIYKSEELPMPMIVMYLNEDITNLKPLVDYLIQLFPDKYNLHSKLSRYNLRLSNTLGWSIGGENHSKQQSPHIHIPLEYQLILINEKLRQSHKMFPRYLSNHTLIHDDNTVNNILSYAVILPSIYTSFREVYSKYGLLEYYTSIFRKLGIPELIGKGGKKNKKNKKTRKKLSFL
jgi:hypothetical protein